jgi:hypothetical protein
MNALQRNDRYRCNNSQQSARQQSTIRKATVNNPQGNSQQSARKQSTIRKDDYAGGQSVCGLIDCGEPHGTAVPDVQTDPVDADPSQIQLGSAG